jgi:Flp pilus assembly protein TadG
MICHPELQRRICSLLKIKRFMRKLGRTDGAEIAEAAMVLPLVFMLLLGIIWFGRAFNIYSTITQAAQQGATVAARPECATCGNAFPADGSVTGPAGTVAFAVATVMNASRIDPAQIPVNSNPPAPVFCASPVLPPGVCSTASNITICRNVKLNFVSGSTQTQQCGVLVSFQYPFKFYLPFTSLNNQQIILSAQAQSRMEN